MYRPGRLLVRGGVQQALGVLRAVLQHRDGLDAAADRDVDAFLDDLVRGHHDRLRARRAEPVHRGGRDGGREPGDDRRDARDVHALRALGDAAARDHVADLGLVHARVAREQLRDAVRELVVRAGQVEGAPVGLRQAGAHAIDDHGLARHGQTSGRQGGSRGHHISQRQAATEDSRWARSSARRCARSSARTRAVPALGRPDRRKMGGLRILLLTTTGRRSGQPRTVPLVFFEDGERLVVIASNGGAPTDPLWWENLKKRPGGRGAGRLRAPAHARAARVGRGARAAVAAREAGEPGVRASTS